ncbi:MAG: hypothetical protein ACP5IE_07775 [Infirmifilum sp.]
MASLKEHDELKRELFDGGIVSYPITALAVIMAKTPVMHSNTRLAELNNPELLTAVELSTYVFLLSMGDKPTPRHDFQRH